MMNRFILGMLTTCLFFPLNLEAQNEIDALRYSQSIYGSTARSMAMGGAFGALGGDFSSLSVNPAGIGIYRSSEFSISAGSITRNTETQFQGNTLNGSKFTVTLGNLGLVLAKTNTNRDSKWKQFSIAVGHNRLNDLGTKSLYQGKNYDNSITDYFAQKVNLDGGASSSELADFYPFDVNLAYQTFVIDPDPAVSGNYISIIPNGNIRQSRTFESKGSQGEFSIAMGANYNNKVTFGISFAFPSIKYEEESVYEEHDVDNTVINPDSTADFKSLRYTQQLATSGNGFNAKLGMIVRVTDGIRLGAAFHTPTWYNLNDRFFSSMQTIVNNTDYYMASPDGVYSYKLNTPMKFVGSLAFIFGKAGILSFDYEYQDYSSMKLKANDYSFSNENKNINKLYTSTGHVFRAGGEFKFEMLSFRLGAAYYGSPFNNNAIDDSYNQSVESLSGGIGYRKNRLKLDIGYSYSQRNENYTAYTLVNETVPTSVTKRVDHRVMLTMGLRF
jgi:hypothetical protein